MNKYDKGYIALYRQFKNWRYYKNDNIKSVFIHCLLSCCWEDTLIEEYQGKKLRKPILLKRGSFLTSIRKLAYELDKTPAEIRYALKQLSTPNLQHSGITQSNSVFTTQEIHITTTHNYTIIYVDKFNDFQLSDYTQQHSENQSYNTVNNSDYNTQLQQHINNIYINKDKKIKRYKDKSTFVHSSNYNNLTLKLLKSEFINEDDVPKMYDELFDELSAQYNLQHINVVLDYLLKKMKNKKIKNKYFYLKKSLEINLEKMENQLAKENHVIEIDHSVENEIDDNILDELPELLEKLGGIKNDNNS